MDISVGQIIITGNDVTRDEVILREMSLCRAEDLTENIQMTCSISTILHCLQR
jgi:outer membrane protein assembly factor BamA